MDGGTGMAGHTAIAVAGVAGSVGLWILGQSDASLPNSVTELGPVVLGAGAGAWFLRWFMSTYVPELQRQHKEQIDRIAESHAAAVSNVTQAHERTIGSMLTTFQGVSKEQQAHFDGQVELIMSLVGREKPGQPADAMRPSNR